MMPKFFLPLASLFCYHASYFGRQMALPTVSGSCRYDDFSVSIYCAWRHLCFVWIRSVLILF